MWHDKEYYENVFQETANKYIDNNYAISARTVNKEDLDLFPHSNSSFWYDKIDEYIHNTATYHSYGSEYGEINHKLYYLPYLRVNPESEIENYNVGDNYEIYLNGYKNIWIIAKIEENELIIIPETPIEIITDFFDEDFINNQIYNIINSFQSNYRYGSGSYINEYGTDDLLNINWQFLQEQTDEIYFYTNDTGFYGDDCILNIGGAIEYKDGLFFENDGTLRQKGRIETFGYRPVVTLKLRQEKEAKKISNEVQIGDNVKYEAKGYKNWKVLSIDKDNNTVDIISGGIVKNITLSGKEDWDNFEDIIQREVDEYKNENIAEKATTIENFDLELLEKVDKKNSLSKYYILSKNNYIKETREYNNYKADFIDYCINLISHSEKNNYEMALENIVLFTDLDGDQEAIDYYYNNKKSSTYTAGIRPIITINLSKVKKLNEDETKRIEESTEKQEKVFTKEQESKNKDYKGPSKVEDSTSSTGNNNEVKTNDNNNTKDNITDNNTSNVEKIVYKDKPFYKYGFYILLVICLIETLLLIIPKINKK